MTHEPEDAGSRFHADGAGLDERIPEVYEELRKLAHRHLRRERPGHTLQTTALVHEAYLRLAGQRELAGRSRGQLLGLAAHMMRRVLVNHALARKAAKRGGAAIALSLTAAAAAGVEPASDGPPVDIEALHAALERLEQLDPRQGRVVELRYFGGMSLEEASEVLGVSVATVKREWRVAKLWLVRELRERPGEGPRV